MSDTLPPSLIRNKYSSSEQISLLRDAFAKDGYVVLDQLFETNFFAEIQNQFRQMREKKKRFDYFCESDSSYRKLSTINGYVIDEYSPILRQLYDHSDFRDWISAIANTELMNCHESLWAIFNIHEGPNCDHGWHADKEAVVFNLMIDENIHEAKQGGGLRLYSEWVRFKENHPGLSKTEMYDIIEREKLYTEVYMAPGQAVLFKGTSVLHKVTSMPHDDSKRVTFLYSWDDEISAALQESEASLVLYK